jgi:beta-glucosidase
LKITREFTMKPFIGIIVLLIFIIFATIPSPAQPRYLNPDLSPAERARILVGQMTLDEKISQMQNVAAAIPRLGVPAYDWWSEALHGVAFAGFATVFPQAIGAGATWDPELLHREAVVISTEARAKYRGFTRKGSIEGREGLDFWSPNINIFRDPRWGRGQETYGEDPFLTGRMGVAFIRGMQGDDSRYLKTIATPKHYAVHSGPESDRHHFDARPPVRDLYETYLPAFEASIVEAGAWSIMGAYNRVNGEPACSSNLLLGELLRNKWGFRGYVVSDCGAIGDIHAHHKIAKNAAESSARAVKAGCDLSCGGEYDSLRQAVDWRLITEEEISTSTIRLMEARFRLGMFDPPGRNPYDSIPESANDTPEHGELAREVAQESMVLLKNGNGTLPLGKPKSIAVIGPFADDVSVLVGNYNGTPSHPVTILEGIKRRAGKDCAVSFARGCDVANGMPRLFPVEARYLNVQESGEMHPGLHAEFFANEKLSGTPCAVRRDTAVSFDWVRESPGMGIPADRYSARWTGLLTTDFTGSRNVGVEVDDGARLYIDDSLIVDLWTRGGRRPATARYSFEAGRPYRIRLEYFEAGGEASITLGWSDESHKQEKEALAVAEKSDVIVAVMGLCPYLEGEEMNISIDGFSGGDRTKLEIPSPQEELLKRLVAMGKPVVLVLTNGSALSIPWEKEHVPAILEAWYPGQEGGNAVADVIFGDYNPAGRLPVTFYTSASDLPAFDNYAMAGRTYRYFRSAPLYPFGYGLSYSSFTYQNANLSHQKVTAKDTILVEVTVRNTGHSDGDEVVQIYSLAKEPLPDDPGKSLVGFQRVRIPAGAVRQARIRIPMRELRTYDPGRNDYVVRPGKYDLEIGSSSADIKLHGEISIKAE